MRVSFITAEVVTFNYGIEILILLGRIADSPYYVDAVYCYRRGERDIATGKSARI